jgi:TorA maturation chaperone TorD
MEQSAVPKETLANLRDFFLASGVEELRAAYTRLTQDEPEAPVVGDWERVEFAYNRLFVGPRSPQAPPYASVYLDEEGTLMGPTTLTIRKVYHAVGLVAPEECSTPDDGLALELDACRQLLVASEVVESVELEQLRGFLARHLAQWLPMFTTRVRAAGGVPDSIEFVLRQLESHFVSERGIA